MSLRYLLSITYLLLENQFCLRGARHVLYYGIGYFVVPILLLLLFSSPPLSVGPNFYGSSCRKVYIKSPKTRLIDQRLYDYCRATHTHVHSSGGTPWFTTFIIYMCLTSWNSSDDFEFAVYVHSDVIYIARNSIYYIAVKQFVSATKAFRHRKH